MTLPVVLRAAARLEMHEAALWYERQRAGLGRDFVEEVQQTLDAISAHPNQFAAVLRDVREAPLSRFPYCLYYRAKHGLIVVISVFHTARDPSNWQDRI